MKTNIALIGFMATGKTAVGELLAKKLRKEFVELDNVIAETAGKSIPEVFRQDGEIRFRELEIEAVRDVASKKNTVIACGGGIVLNKINIDRLKKESVIICLTASLPVVLKRSLHDKDNRPLLNVADREKQIKELFDFRRPFYNRAADIIVNTSRLNIKAVVDKIIGTLKNYESYNR
jgi:shikimate kinase